MINYKLSSFINITSKTGKASFFLLVGFFSALIILSNCGKKEAEPDIADRVTGNYLLNEFKSGINSYVLPYKKDTIEFNASILVSKLSIDKIKLVIKTYSKIGNKSLADSINWSLTLRQLSNNDIEAINLAGESRTIFSGNKINCYFGETDTGDLGYLLGVKK